MGRKEKKLKKYRMKREETGRNGKKWEDIQKVSQKYPKSIQKLS